LERSNIAFRVNRDVWMITLISKEWRNTSSNTRNTIVRELYKQQEFGPVVLLVITIYMEVLLEDLVHVFSLFITFRVIA